MSVSLCASCVRISILPASGPSAVHLLLLVVLLGVALGRVSTLLGRVTLRGVAALLGRVPAWWV